MSIGAELADARRQAGLTVTQISQRTRIRPAIIEGIERDDFSVCGGDFYARGHIRAIARVAGVDPEPLVREYDDARQAATGEDIPVGRPRQSRGPGTVPARPGLTAAPSGLAAGRPGRMPGTASTGARAASTGARAASTGAGTASTGAGAASKGAGTASTGAGTASTGAGTASAEPVTAGADRGAAAIVVTGQLDAVPGRPGLRAQPPPRPRRSTPWTILLVVLLAAAVAVIVYQATQHPAGPAAAKGRPAAASRPSAAPSASASPVAKSAPPTSPPRPSQTSPPPSSVVIALTAVSEPCWAQLTMSNGTTIYQGILSTGTSMSWTEAQPVTLALGNPGAVTLTVDGQVRTGLGINPVTLNLGPGQPPAG